jgi:hypothetical protein
MAQKVQKKAGALRLGFRAFSITFGATVGLSIGGTIMYFTTMFLVALTMG